MVIGTKSVWQLGGRNIFASSLMSQAETQNFIVLACSSLEDETKLDSVVLSFTKLNRLQNPTVCTTSCHKKRKKIQWSIASCLLLLGRSC
jgi:hypothetical protein